MTNLPIKIKIEMLKKGISGAEVARRAGVTRQAIYHVIEGKSCSPNLRRAIAEALEKDPREFWPSWEEAA